MAAAVAVMTVPVVAFGGFVAADATTARPAGGVGAGVQRATAAAGPVAVQEQEPATVRGRNDTPQRKQIIEKFGTAKGKVPAARVSGTLAAPVAPQRLPTAPEDNGSTKLAATLALPAGGDLRGTGTIGDGPHGSAGDKKGDFDFYALRGAKSGQWLDVTVDTPASGLRPMVQIWDEAAEQMPPNMVTASKDKGSYSIGIEMLIEDSDIFIAVQSAGSELADSADSGSGNGVRSEGAYTVTFSLDSSDTDVYAVDLAAGDVLSAGVTGGAGGLQVFDSARKLAVGSDSIEDASSISRASPLVTEGNAALNHIAARPGRYFVAVHHGQGAYQATLRVHRPGPETKKAIQTIFIDLDGASVDPGIFDPAHAQGLRKLSPLSSFISKWGITKAQENALTDQIVKTVTENLRDDFAGQGSKVTILNSRDHPDPFGKPNVSRIIFGGDAEAAFGDTVGNSQSIDPGNMVLEETAVVLLDWLTGTDANDDQSLTIHMTAKSDRVKFVGTALATVGCHEAGHYLGLFHAYQEKQKPNIMLPGTEGSLYYGLGADKTGGTADDVDVDYLVTQYGYGTDFSGVQDARTRIRWALS